MIDCKLKFIATGNRLMMDDGIAIFVAEALKNKLEDLGFEVLIAETDALFCFHLVNSNDFVILLDSAFLNERPGSLHTMSLTEALYCCTHQNSLHQTSFLNLMQFYQKPLQGYFIGIEIAKVDCGLSLSEDLLCQFHEICEKVEQIIQRICKNTRYVLMK